VHGQFFWALDKIRDGFMLQNTERFHLSLTTKFGDLTIFLCMVYHPRRLVQEKTCAWDLVQQAHQHSSAPEAPEERFFAFERGVL